MHSSHSTTQSAGPFLKTITTVGSWPRNKFPFTIPALHDGLNLHISRNVTFLVGENGCAEDKISEVTYKETDHYLLMKRFLDAPERYYNHLFSDN